MKISPTIRASLELLGVNAETSANELKKAYHKLAFLYHPDRNPDPGAVAEFRKITEAYDLLSDPLRVAELNRKHMTERLHKTIVEGFDITYGSFFGYRLFQDIVEENNSILDHRAFDAIEVVYAGKLSKEDESAIQGVRGEALGQLPWVILNNQGLLRFLEGDLRRSAKCYRELCERIPNNIIFMYRYGLCLILDGFQNPKTTILGLKKPDRIKIEKGMKLLDQCIKLGTERQFGRQKCLVIRKIVADVRERLGQRSLSKKIWKTVLELDPSSVEATFRVRGLEAAEKLRKRKTESLQIASGIAPDGLKLLARNQKR